MTEREREIEREGYVYKGARKRDRKERGIYVKENKRKQCIRGRKRGGERGREAKRGKEREGYK